MTILELITALQKAHHDHGDHTITVYDPQIGDTIEIHEVEWDEGDEPVFLLTLEE